MLAALPAGVSVAGLKLHVAPAGKPEHAKLTCELNPFAGVTVSVRLPWPAALMVRVDALAPNVNVGGGGGAGI